MRSSAKTKRFSEGFLLLRNPRARESIFAEFSGSDSAKRPVERRFLEVEPVLVEELSEEPRRCSLAVNVKRAVHDIVLKVLLVFSDRIVSDPNSRCRKILIQKRPRNIFFLGRLL